MSNSISATSTNNASYEAVSVDTAAKGEVATTNMSLEKIDNTASKAALEKALQEEGVPGLVKAFSEILTQLVSTLSAIMGKFSSMLSQNDKKVKKETNEIKLGQKKTSKAEKKKNNEAVALAKSEAERAASAVSAKNITPATAPAIAAQAASGATEAVAKDETKLSTEPAKGQASMIVDSLKGFTDDNLSVVTNKQGRPEVFTQDGYSLIFDGSNQAWNILDPNGRLTRIWGDPHVIESDGDKWDFKERSSFLFGKNKVTVETAPAGNGETFSSRVTIYNGGSRISINGIDKDKPLIEAVSQDAIIDDALRDDGDLFILGKEANGEDQFLLLKDIGEKFDPNFAKQVGVGTPNLLQQYLTEEQKGFVKH